jgi:hypothetical protein
MVARCSAGQGPAWKRRTRFEGDAAAGLESALRAVLKNHCTAGTRRSDSAEPEDGFVHPADRLAPPSLWLRLWRGCARRWSCISSHPMHLRCIRQRRARRVTTPSRIHFRPWPAYTPANTGARPLTANCSKAQEVGSRRCAYTVLVHAHMPSECRSFNAGRARPGADRA